MYVHGRTFVNDQKSWEIVRAPLSNGATPVESEVVVNFESLFRTMGKFEWNECDFECCNERGHAYVQAAPKSFQLCDGGEILIEW